MQQKIETENNNTNHTSPPNENSTIYVGGTHSDYSTIQDAINAAKNGTTILINNGSYNELLIINKTITLKGEDKNTTILNYSPNIKITRQLQIITINADNCSIENLHITLSNKSNFLQTETISEGCCGKPDVIQTRIHLAGGITIHSSFNTIKNTIITNASEGIKLLADSTSNIITYNEIRNNQIGIETLNSINNTISHNIISNNQQYNIFLSIDSNLNKISFNNIDASTFGVRIKASQYNNVSQNCIKNNSIGVACCCDAKSNYIHTNILITNSYRNAEENINMTNIWYDNKSRMGNYWDNYTGSDKNHDGIGDIPYTIPDSGNQDMYPLMTVPFNIVCN